MPRSICERMTPLLPRAPSSAASASALLIAPAPPDSGRAAFAARSVSSMLVPVSPSGTG